MGRFETSAEFYRFREPYPPEFFASVAAKLKLGEDSRMLDVACGPGNLAIGFAPFVGGCVAVDIEAEMLREGRAAATGLRIEFVQVAVEDMKAGDGVFDFVTIGRAIHWLDRHATLAVFERVIAKGGRVAVCAALVSDADCNAWEKKFREVRRVWSGDHDEARYRPDLDEWFAGSRFRRAEEIAVRRRYQWTVEDLVNRGLSFSVTSPAVLGERRGEFEAEMRAALEPFSSGGVVEEEVMAKATVFG
jgi:ubiquinone/menaquinone biosynthesis C-methylase UbiE